MEMAGSILTHFICLVFDVFLKNLGMLMVRYMWVLGDCQSRATTFSAFGLRLDRTDCDACHCQPLSLSVAYKKRRFIRHQPTASPFLVLRRCRCLCSLCPTQLRMASFAPSGPSTSGRRVREADTGDERAPSRRRSGGSDITQVEDRMGMIHSSAALQGRCFTGIPTTCGDVDNMHASTSESYCTDMEARESARSPSLELWLRDSTGVSSSTTITGTGSSSSTGTCTKLPIPCDFHAKGWCIRGESCRFLHSDQRLAASSNSELSLFRSNIRIDPESFSFPQENLDKSFPDHGLSARSGSQSHRLDLKVDDSGGKDGTGADAAGIKAPKDFENALIVHVKELLEPSWANGYLRKDDFKAIVKKSVDKVLRSFQPLNAPMPSTSEEIKAFISSSEAKLTS
ncbi:uncharacterized protein LOC127248120 isoform X5 [Andrographis paniculata]|uniref:uncharacterized protein LOC127248120 isoform X5 n=1 Tax=Andrographis paniculata TaxID=175694 RepID=UPI0021E73439|nr:uncharacterized protein LOC127248120 isoform X5 [Andrographis paniculata]XP_051126281.1 uncharacterized protein LOC127248120 isoform X5 [Andrographis paniculata]